MLHKIGVALIAATLAAAPALAIDTQPPAASPAISPIAKPKKVSTGKSKKLAKTELGKTELAKTELGKTAGNPRQRLAKTSTATGAKANPVLATQKSKQSATALPAGKKSKHAKSKSAKSKIAKSKIAKSKIAKSKIDQSKSSKVAARPAKNRMPADDTGPGASRSVPTPGLY